ncbi:GNAT family N-acetyltransferase [Rhodalgimonas zhirmunskyi]|uniref:GNAT family N-acetyltransferase n=1 Tax=Rhodalgimonas zhirmunskyi TaxID=2964767 RepID=A0AAJ1X6P5_9RHOB|nr:GNAT family N-acetyltransferase [Rhodoalgimonas zhirmunskyi]MDQ2095419.1 GNAT family N-acetyltransferase [Rhodoalgimonas zhirmunskyi]
MIRIRSYTPDDAAPLHALFHVAIHKGAAGHYTPAQRAAWSPSSQMPASWPTKLAALETRVALRDREIAGFMAMTPEGYLDLAFTHPDHTRHGVATALHSALLELARTRGLTRLTTHASLAARAFFDRHGWQVTHAEKVARGGETLDRFAMSLSLGPQT